MTANAGTRDKPVSAARRVRRHIRNRLISGLFVLVPLVITVGVIRITAGAMASLLTPFVRLFLGPEHPALEAAIAIAAFVLLVYLAGLVTAYLIGRRLVAVGEALILRIPLVGSLYAGTKQIVKTLAPAGRDAFKSVVMVEFPRPGVRSLGFVTGGGRGSDGRATLRVFVPTAPNPTSGFLLFVDEGEAVPSSLSVEEAFRLVVSGGVLAPGPANGPAGPPAGDG
jgi:uncharacterized membrane protein